MRVSWPRSLKTASLRTGGGSRTSRRICRSWALAAWMSWTGSRSVSRRSARRSCSRPANWPSPTTRRSSGPRTAHSTSTPTSARWRTASPNYCTSSPASLRDAGLCGDDRLMMFIYGLTFHLYAILVSIDMLLVLIFRYCYLFIKY